MKTVHYIIILIILGVLGSCGDSQYSESKVGQEPARELSELDRLNNAIEADSTNVDLYIQRANLHLQYQDPNRALGDIGDALEIEPKNAQLYVILADTYMAMGEMNSCIEALDKAEELDPENASGLLKQAEVYLILRDYQTSFKKIRQVLQIDTYNPTAYFIRGYGLLEYGDTNAAVRNLMTAVEQDQEYYEAFMQLGLLYAEKGDPLAVSYYNNAIQSRPNRPEPYYFLGMFFQEREELLKAVEVYNNLLAIDPEYTDAYYNLGYIYLVYLEEYDLAVNYFGNVLDREEANYEAWYNRGYAHELGGNHVEARKDYKQALKLVPNYNLAVEGMNRLDRKIEQ
jgi:tetratricopeptide (TPR) repeat protein